VVPGLYDTAYVGGGPETSPSIILTNDVDIATIVLTNGTIDLAGYNLTIHFNALFEGGNIYNTNSDDPKIGRLAIKAEKEVFTIGKDTIGSSATFSGTIFANGEAGTIGVVTEAKVDRIYLSGSKFLDSLIITKTGKGNDRGKGGNTFNGPVILSCNGLGSLVLGDSLPDTFNSKLYVNSVGQVSFAPNAVNNGIFIAHASDGNQFNDDVIFNEGIIFSNSSGTAFFNGNIFIHGTSGTVNFGGGERSACVLDGGKSIFTETRPYYTNEYVYLKHFKFEDYDGILELELDGNSGIFFESGSEFNLLRISVEAPLIGLNGSSFDADAKFTQTGGSITSLGGNHFFKGVNIIHNGADDNSFFSLGTTAEDSFDNGAVIENTNGSLAINKAIFKVGAIFRNKNTSTTSDRFYLGYTGTCILKGNITLEDSISGMSFGNSGGQTYFDSTAVLSIHSGFTGNLTLKNFVQRNNHNLVSITLPNNDNKLIINTGTSFTDGFKFYGRNIQLNGGTFSGDVTIKRYGSSGDICSGGNTFNGSVLIQDSSSSANDFILANSSPDYFNDNVTFVQKGPSVNLYPSYTKNSTFLKNISFNSTSPIKFGQNGGKVLFSGSSQQDLSKLDSGDVTFKKIEVNKSQNYLSLKIPITVTDSLKIIKGIIRADSLLIIPDNGIVSSGNDSCFIQGGIKKIGNDPFTFPLGDNTLPIGNRYHPLMITAPSSTSDAFRAQYIPEDCKIANTSEEIVASDCEYWLLKNIQGNSSVSVSLGWNTNMCSMYPNDMLITAFSGSAWLDLGQGSLIDLGGGIGSISSAQAVSVTPGIQLPVTIGSKTNRSYAMLKAQLDGGYYRAKNERLYFKYDGEYNSGSLNYKVYNSSHQVISNGCPFNPIQKIYGDNRYILNFSLSGCTGFSTNKMYILEVTNEKNEKFYLRFKYE
jgi:hypothetical protein